MINCKQKSFYVLIYTRTHTHAHTFPNLSVFFRSTEMFENYVKTSRPRHHHHHKKRRNTDCGRYRSCEHHTDDGYIHTTCDVSEDGNISHARCECTSYNATCGDDSSDLLRMCLPQLFPDHDSVTKSIMWERSHALDKYHNFQNERRTRFVDPQHVIRMASLHTDEHREKDSSEIDNHDVEVISRSDISKLPMMSASADVFDVYPTINSEYPIMVRRPWDCHIR